MRLLPIAHSAQNDKANITLFRPLRTACVENKQLTSSQQRDFAEIDRTTAEVGLATATAIAKGRRPSGKAAAWRTHAANAWGLRETADFPAREAEASDRACPTLWVASPVFLFVLSRFRGFVVSWRT
jgi:hypothetical protein